jgi:hypothetical protein
VARHDGGRGTQWTCYQRRRRVAGWGSDKSNDSPYIGALLGGKTAGSGRHCARARR